MTVSIINALPNMLDASTLLSTIKALKIPKYNIDSLDNRKEEIIEWTSPIVNQLLKNYFQSEVRGLDRIPKGAALYVGNHNSAMMVFDSFIFCSELAIVNGLDDVPYGLGHEVTISLPFVHQIIVPLGAVRASHTNAHRLFQAGKKVLVYPGGDYDAMRPFRHRNKIVFGGRKGYIRLALNENVPIVPVVAAGAHSTYIIIDDLRWLARLLRIDKTMRMKVFPLTLSMPWGLTLGPVFVHIPYPSQILIEVLPPISFDRTGPDASQDTKYVSECAERVESTMQQAMDRLVNERKPFYKNIFSKIIG